MMTGTNNIGLYIHIPFCESKCPYCDFYSVKAESELIENYTKAVIDTIEKYKHISKKCDTLYFGGGTPTVLGDDNLVKIIEKAREFFLTDNAEITVECNPRKNLNNTFKALSNAGVNRISLGMQSAVDKERFALGRKADSNDVERAVYYAKSNLISNISLDLMLGIPNMTIESLDKSIDFIERVNVNHISAYILKIEKGTPFEKLQNKLNLPDEDKVCDMYLHTVDRLKQIGLNQYEISNFSKSGCESKHNLKYWQCEEYLGIGASAHSFLDGKRFYYPRDINAFINGNLPVQDGFGGDDEEKIMLGLRLTKGISDSYFNNHILNKVNHYAKMGLLKYENNNISLTPKGFLLSNEIICELLY